MRVSGALFFAIALVTPAAFAVPQAVAQAMARPDLAPGKPAGVKQAQMNNNTVMAVGALGLLGVGIGLAASGDSNAITPATTTTTTTTTSSTGTSP